jgi:hypothetical protein
MYDYYYDCYYERCVYVYIGFQRARARVCMMIIMIVIITRTTRTTGDPSVCVYTTSPLSLLSVYIGIESARARVRVCITVSMMVITRTI